MSAKLVSILRIEGVAWSAQRIPKAVNLDFIVPDSLVINCSNYRGISLLSTPYNILSNIILSRLSPYIDKIIGDHQCGFRRNKSSTDQIFAFVKYWRRNGSTMGQYISSS
jgi:hypothetical protein